MFDFDTFGNTENPNIPLKKPDTPTNSGRIFNFDTFGTESTPETAAPEKTVGDYAKKAVTGTVDFFTRTAQDAGDMLGQAAQVIAFKKEVERNNANYLKAAKNMQFLAKQETDPVKKETYMNRAKEYFDKAGRGIQESVGRELYTNKEVLGTFGQLALEVGSFGSYGAAAKAAQTGKALLGTGLVGKAVGGALGKVGVDTIYKTAISSVPTAFKALSTQGLKQAAARSVGGGVLGYSFDVANNLRQDVEGLAILKPGYGLLIGTSIPMAAYGFRAGKEAVKKAAMSTIKYAADLSDNVVLDYLNKTKKVDALIKDKVDPDDALKVAQGAVRNLRGTMSEEWRTAVASIEQKYPNKITLNGTGRDKQLRNIAAEFGPDILSKVDDRGNIIPINPSSMTFNDAMAVLKNINELYSKRIVRESSQGIQVRSFKDFFKQYVIKNFGGDTGEVATLYKNYSAKKSVFDAANDIVNAYQTGRPIKQATALGRLRSIFKENKGAYLKAIRNLEEQTGVDITSYITAGEMNKGLISEKIVTSGGGGIFSKKGVLDKIFEALLSPITTMNRFSRGIIKLSRPAETVIDKATKKTPFIKKMFPQTGKDAPEAVFNTIIGKAQKIQPGMSIKKITPEQVAGLKKIYKDSIATHNLAYLSQGKETVGKKAQEELTKNGVLNPNIVKGRMDDVARKLREDVGISSSYYEKLMKSKTFKNWEDLDKFHREFFAKLIPDGSFSKSGIKTPISGFKKNVENTVKIKEKIPSFKGGEDLDPIILKNTNRNKTTEYRLSNFADKDGYLYHITSPNNIESIKKGGLNVSKNGYQGRGVYFAPDEATASGQASHDGAVVRVNIKNIDAKKIISGDVNGFGETTELVYGNKIPASAIEIKTKNGWKSLTKPQLIEEWNKTNKIKPKSSQTNKIEDLTKEAQILRGTKGMTADDIMKKYPNIRLDKDVSFKYIYDGSNVQIPKNEVLTPYELKNDKILLQDGKTYIVSKNQFQNIKGNSTSSEAKPFAPELGELEETVKKTGYSPIFRNGDIRYHQYQLPDGKNYREILIKAPLNEDKIKWSKDGDYIKGTIGNISVVRKTKEDVMNYFKEGNYTNKFNAYKSPHWREPNVISHIRMNERTYKGKKVAFMEELQSDWAREVRMGKNVPQNKDLKNWQKLSVKRALKEAVDADADYFAWINGEQTSERYNLATHLDNVRWNAGKTGVKKIELKPKASGEDIILAIDKNGEVLTGSQHQMIGKKLDEVLGKGLADKIMEKESGKLSGEGLKFGGEWAHNLYDKQVKNIVEDFTGGKVVEMDMGLPIEGKQKTFSSTKTTIQQGIKLTPEIKAKIRGEALKLENSGKMFEDKLNKITGSSPIKTILAGAGALATGLGIKTLVSKTVPRKTIIYPRNPDESKSINDNILRVREPERVSTVINPQVKGVFKEAVALIEQYGNTKGNWMQLEPETIKDLQDRYGLDKTITLDKIKKDPSLYDKVVLVYKNKLAKENGLKSDYDQALWLWRPTWYKKYKGDIEKIPEDLYVYIDGQRKKAKDVLKDRKRKLDEFFKL